MKTFVSILLFILSFQSTMCLSATENEIWKKLKTGGLVILMRHATVRKENNPLLRDPSCLNERNLSEKGKQDAIKIGEQFSAKGVPVDTVLASPYCRTTATAKNAFGRSKSVEFLAVLEAFPQKQAEAYTERLMSKIGSYSNSGNLVLVTHAPNINAVSFDLIEIGAFLVLQPMGGEEFEEIGKINFTN